MLPIYLTLTLALLQGTDFCYSGLPTRENANCPPSSPTVPLCKWTSTCWPTNAAGTRGGLNLGIANGVSWGDFDADGWPDLFSLRSGKLFRNCEGQDWALICDVVGSGNLLPNAVRYGSSFGDYNNDGFPDIACEPRPHQNDNCFYLLENLGGWPQTCHTTRCTPTTACNLVDITSLAMTQPCGDATTDVSAETACWGDVDGDGNLDLFLPAYVTNPNNPVPAGTGNFFFLNEGPNASGQYTFDERAVAVGLKNTDPPQPEGAQFVDYDRDGDIDLFCNYKLYRNVSTDSDQKALFEEVGIDSGIVPDMSRDEGVVLADKDLDGDFDLFILYPHGIEVYEAKGDGSFELLDSTTGDSPIECPELGRELGLSAVDWDNDGDIDITTENEFRRNDLDLVAGTELFRIADHDMNPSDLIRATPAWADWDKDGDLDCAIGRHQLGMGTFYENTLYDEWTPDDQRRYVRVRIMRDDPQVARGLETEYGASAEVHVVGEGTGIRRRWFTASSAGYLTQNEYPLHFGLPADPVPADPAIDLFFDVSVDLTGRSDVFRRIDKHTNPALGGIALGQLVDREIVVYRSGKVVLDGIVHLPLTPGAADLTTTNKLVAPESGASFPGLTALGQDRFVGLAIEVPAGAPPQRLAEIILDGQLASGTSCGLATGNVFVWDTTVPLNPQPVLAGFLDFETRVTNDRSYFPTNIPLEPGRSYRIVAHVQSSRLTGLDNPIDFPGRLKVLGGLSFIDASPCSGHGVESAALKESTGMALRFGNM